MGRGRECKYITFPTVTVSEKGSERETVGETWGERGGGERERERERERGGGRERERERGKK